MSDDVQEAGPRGLHGIGAFVKRHPIASGLVGVFALWLVYQSNDRFIGGSDVYPARFIPISLVTEYDYDLDEFTFIRDNDGTGGGPGGQVFPEHGKPYDGRYLSYYPTFIPTILSPFYVIPFRLLGVSPKHFFVFYLDKGFAALFAALSACFVFLALRATKVPRGAALAIVIAYGVGTSTWTISSQSLWQHAPSQCFLALSLWLWIRSRRTANGFFWLGLALGAAVGARPSNAMWVALLSGDLLAGLLISKRRRWKDLGLYVAGGAPAFLFLVFYNWRVFGAPWISGYSFNPAILYLEDWIAWKNLPAGGLGLLFSPSMGIIPNAPFYLFVPLAVWIALRWPLHGSARRHVVLPLLFVIAHWMLYGCYREWWAGWSYCYRYLTDITPMLSFLLGSMWRIRPPDFLYRFDRPTRKLAWGAFAVLTLWATAVQGYGAYIWSGQQWFGPHWENINQRIFLGGNQRAAGSIFDKESVFWTLDWNKHLIGSEFQNGAPQALKDPREWFATPPKIYRDLFDTREIPYGRYPPIIQHIGD